MFRESRFVFLAAAFAVGVMAANVRTAAAEEARPLRFTVADTAPTGAADGSFLVTGIAKTYETEEQQSTGQARHEGVGVGVKGGFLFNNFKQAKADIDNKGGWLVGIFFGGNRPGVVGVMGELMYGKKSYALTGQTTDLYFIEIPILVRINIGSSSLNGISVYGIVGPVFDVNLQSKIDGVKVSDKYESLDIGAIFGGGIEITRFLVEARYNKGFKNALKSTGASISDLKTSSFAVLVGLRFN